jgi:hypothetical protein
MGGAVLDPDIRGEGFAEILEEHVCRADLGHETQFEDESTRGTEATLRATSDAFPSARNPANGRPMAITALTTLTRDAVFKCLVLWGPCAC